MIGNGDELPVQCTNTQLEVELNRHHHLDVPLPWGKFNFLRGATPNEVTTITAPPKMQLTPNGNLIIFEGNGLDWEMNLNRGDRLLPFGKPPDKPKSSPLHLEIDDASLELIVNARDPEKKQGTSELFVPASAFFTNEGNIVFVGTDGIARIVNLNTDLLKPTSQRLTTSD